MNSPPEHPTEPPTSRPTESLVVSFLGLAGGEQLEENLVSVSDTDTFLDVATRCNAGVAYSDDAIQVCVCVGGG